MSDVEDQDIDSTASQRNIRDLLKLLLQQGEITREDAEQARRRMKRSNISAQQALTDLDTLSAETVYGGLAVVNSMPFVKLYEIEVEKEAIQKVPVKVALHYRCLGYKLEKGILTAAFSDPPSVRDKENLRMLMGIRINPSIATPIDIQRSIKTHYGIGAETVVQIHQEGTFRSRHAADFDFDNQDLAEEDADIASIRHLVNQILKEALEMGATDIHVEPFDESVQLRYRIDGMLRIIPTPAGLRELHSAIVSRMKVMANLDIAEKRLPHDGRIRINIASEEFDLRVSVIPTRFGESLNLRILNRATVSHDLGRLGLEPQQLEILTKLLNMPHGMMLVTGPTGSGKSTTLYGALDKTDKVNRKVITVEDPVEYQIEGINQIQVHSRIGLTFARGLRSILRHDPDIVLIGEIRDGETAEIAIRAAMTGHLVLSTLHTNDSVSAVNRMVDMGVEPFLVASTLRAALAQRLTRRICPHCKEVNEEVPDRVLDEISRFLEIEEEDFVHYKGTGCVECDYRGYTGRVAIYEFFLMTEELEDLIAAGSRTSDLRRVAKQNGMTSLRQNGWLKVARGDTTVQEVLRITTAFDIRY
jgi:general secretion pathway protein E/type IV pilus assembly protein PilB